MRPMMNRIDASSQSPVSTKNSAPVVTTPTAVNQNRNFFLPRMTSEIVPRIGERMALISSEMLRPMLQ